MAECSECGEKSMSFTCRYCGEKFCSEHRLPEKHECEGLEGESPEEHEEWFEDKFSEKKSGSGKSSKQSSGQDKIEGRPAQYKTHKKSIFKDLFNTVTGSVTLAVIGITFLSYIFQLSVPGYQEFLILDTHLSELIRRPWSLLTVVLLHSPVLWLHIVGNMITFYFFATPLERLLGGKKMLKIYISSALIASIGMVVFHNVMRFLHGDASMAGLVVGASGGVIALVAVVSKLFPEADVLLFFIIPMKIKTAVYGFGAFEVINITVTLLGIEWWILPIEFFASAGHLAGLLAGLYYGEKLKDKYNRNRGQFNPLA